MKFVLEAYLWVGVLFGLLTLTFGMIRERSKDQPGWMTALKWLLGAGAAGLAWPVAAYWVLEGELIRRSKQHSVSEALNAQNGQTEKQNQP